MKIISLCGGTGAWEKPYKKAGYEIELVEIKHGVDVKTYHP